MAKKKDGEVIIEFMDDASIALKEFGKITQRNMEEVVSDALRIYMWILFEQTFGGTVTACHSDQKENRKLKNLVKNRDTSEKYLEKYRNLMRKHPDHVSIQED